MNVQVSRGSLMTLLVAPLVAVFGTTGDVHGQDFPVRPIRFIVPYTPGGSTDLLARVAAPRMNETWGQPVIVDNRPGAAGNIGNDIAAKAPPDGYTIVMTTMSTAISMSYYRKLPLEEGQSLPATMSRKSLTCMPQNRRVRFAHTRNCTSVRNACAVRTLPLAWIR
jgi:hypothetical protein